MIRRLYALLYTTLFLVGASPDTQAQVASRFSIGWYAISPGSSALRGGCFIVNGSMGQPTPGYSSAGTFSLLSGYWSVAPITGTDEIFFNGFQVCSP